ncbi:MAG: acetylxylan esterase [Lentisphaeria bacterium]|nr:acetylxylan esterase [Lentisphaeria bacterium]
MTPIFGNAVQEYYLDLVRKNYWDRKARLEAIRTREDAEKYVAEVREKVLSLFPLPQEKTPLDARITGSKDMGSYIIQNVIFHSRPGFPVTSNLYLPKADGKVPAVLMLCGHSGDGKLCDTYQACCHSLAMKGYAVLIVDPVSQGERLQFTKVPEFAGYCCQEHNIMNKQLLLTGDTIGAWRAWDGIRGLDYLLSRPEVDTARVGVTGNSGGGTMSTFVNALESRFTMAAPSCYLTTWKRNVENELPADGEQMPPGTFAAGLEMADFVIARAPRPILIMGQKNDFFDARGTRETYEEVKRIYALLGVEDKVRLWIGPTNHGYSIENRESMYSFFNEIAGVDASGKEPENLQLLGEELNCTPGGQVCDTDDNKYIREFAVEQAAALRAGRTLKSKTELVAALRDALKIDPEFVPYSRTLRIRWTRNEKASYFSTFGLETEQDRVMSVLKLRSNRDYYHLPEAAEADLYIPHLDSQDEMDLLPFDAADPVLHFGLDIRGIGECTPSCCDQPFERNFFREYEFDYHYTSLGLMFGKSYLGGRVKDILCAVELLSKTVGKITLTACKQGAIPAMIAALLSDKISKIKLIDAPESWESMVIHPCPPETAISVMPYNILALTDLPEIRAALADKLV